MANQREMNSWSTQQETIEVLKWGDPRASLQFLRRHQDYKHIKRMVLERLSYFGRGGAALRTGTICKHVERILSKLCVEHRTAAAAMALAALTSAKTVQAA